MKTIRLNIGTTMLASAALSLALVTGAWAQSSSDSSKTSAAQSTAATGNAQTSPAPQPAPGTTPVGSDQAPPPPHAKSASQQPNSAPSAQPAPGTTPVGGDQAPPPPNANTKESKQGNDKKNHHGKRDKKNKNNNDNVQVDPDKVVGVGSELIKVKPGSIEDVNAVGNRCIGCRGLGNWYSTEGEIKMGKMYADQIEKSARFINDPVVDEYVNRIGQNIVKNSDCKVPFTIKVLDSDEINAFALPGGFFYVNSGLILAADEEAELAGVMAHETAHVCAHHAAREMTRMNYAEIGSIPLIMMTGYSWTGMGIYEASQLAIPVAFLQFSRDFEAQADYLGVQYMYRAGYDPQAFIDFFEKIQALEKRKPGLVARAFSDHPQTPDRILHTQEEIAKILPAKPEYLVTTSEFNRVKARLARIEDRRRLTDMRNKNRPSLRRASTNPNGQDNGSNGNSGSSGNSTDQPTLHRRNDQN